MEDLARCAPSLRGRRRGFLHGNGQVPEWVPGCPPRDGSELLETPTHSFVDGRKPVHERRSLCPRPPALMVTVVVGSFLP